MMIIIIIIVIIIITVNNNKCLFCANKVELSAITCLTWDFLPSFWKQIDLEKERSVDLARTQHLKFCPKLP